MARIRKHFDIVEDDMTDRVEVDYFDRDFYLYLEVKQAVNLDDDDEDRQSALVTLSPEKAEKIARALLKGAAEARKAKRDRG